MELLEIFVFLGSILVCFLAAAIVGHFTEKSLGAWYLRLSKPAITPPEWVFTVIWSLLYLLMGLALGIVLTEGRPEQLAAPVLLFVIQLCLRIAWAAAFFGQRNPAAGFVILMMQWLFTALTSLSFAAVAFEAGMLLIPHLLWISFGLILNYRFLKLNRIW
ncbi:MAG TPA: TspO/MBR family protein [Candidatus Obscuribacterales bacterium]